MSLMTDQEDVIPFTGKLDGLDMDFGHQRTGGVNGPKVALQGGFTNLWGDSMGAVENRRAVGDFLDGIDKNHPFGFKSIHHRAVVDDFVVNKDWGAE